MTVSDEIMNCISAIGVIVILLCYSHRHYSISSNASIVVSSPKVIKHQNILHDIDRDRDELHQIIHPNQPKSSDWINDFCSKDGNEYYLKIPMSFFEDSLNLNYVLDVLLNQVNLCDDTQTVYNALELITDKYDALIPISKVEHKIAVYIYNLLHSRYCLSIEGLQMIQDNFFNGLYGQCPRVLCNGYNLLPVGLHDQLDVSTMKCYCAKCRDIYHPHLVKYRNIDGGIFGTTLPHLLLQLNLNIAPSRERCVYVQKIYGFEIDDSAEEKRIFDQE